jgi:hypothetical protein
MPNFDGRTGATSHTGLTDDEKRRVRKDRNQKAAQRGSGNAGRLAIEADTQPTILGREMVLRKLDAAKVAAKTGVHESRIESIAAGKSTAEKYEVEGLESTFRLPADLLASPNNADSRRRVMMERPL